MPCCSAVNCSNRSEKGYKLFRFPTGDRGLKWVQNMRRGDKWSPTGLSRLCEIHFENSQFESHRLDNWRKLKPNAIPSLFNVPNPPPMFDPPPRKSLYKFVGTDQKALYINLYKDKMKIQAENPESPQLSYKEMIQEISKACGIGRRTIITTLSEYKKQGTVTSPT